MQEQQKMRTVVRCSSYWGGSPQDRLRDEQTCRTTLASAYVLHHLSATWSQLQMMGVSADQCIAIEHRRSSSIKVIFVDYQTSKLQCNYQSYIQMNSIEDTWGFSVETLTRITPSWKTELNRSISTVKDGISRGFQHRHNICCEKGGYCGRQACMFWR